MRLSEFILLNEADKKRSVMQQGALLAKRTCSDYVVFLFQFEDYYIETYCDETNKVIDEYRILPDTNALKHYLEAIAIDDLLN